MPILFQILPIVRDKRRDVSVTCFTMVDSTEKKAQSNFLQFPLPSKFIFLIFLFLTQRGYRTWPSIRPSASPERKKAKFSSWIGDPTRKRSEGRPARPVCASPFTTDLLWTFFRRLTLPAPSYPSADGYGPSGKPLIW